MLCHVIMLHNLYFFSSSQDLEDEPAATQILQEESQRAVPEKDKVLESLRKSRGGRMEGAENTVVTEVFINFPILEQMEYVRSLC